jgi:uncharacterized membrane protein
MCSSLKNCFNEALALTKTWSIRKQMMVCYIMAMVVILFLILFLVFFNLYLLRQETISKVEKTLDEQASDNMKALIKECGSYVFSHTFEVMVLFDMLKEMLIDMYDEDTFALSYLNTYTYEEVNTKYHDKCYKNEALYGKDNYYCTAASCIFPNDFPIEQDLVRKVSRFDNFWPTILDLTNSLTFRFMVYFNSTNIEEEFMKVYPAISIPENYSIRDQKWYKEYQDWLKEEHGSQIYSSNMYYDQLGNEINQIVTLASNMVNDKNEMIGVISADIMVDEILEGIQRLKYLESGYSAMVTRDGYILKTEKHNYFWKDLTTLEEVEDQTFVSKLKNMNNSNETMFYLLEDNVLYRVAAQMIGPVIIDADSTDDFWYTVLLIVEESEIMKYKHESEDKIQEAGIYLILITLSASLVTIIVIVILIHYLAKSITEPLQGIIDFTNKINANATEKDMVTIEELEKLKDGEDQVAHLVQAFKSLASGLINRREDRMPRALQTTQTKVYPPNELYKSNKITWRELIERIPQ